MKNNEFLLTIITPTYNREHTLSNLYESLKSQTNKKFNWLIVDDGSTDHTKKLVKQFMNENIIKIDYIFQVNGGKHRALNRGIKKISTMLTFIVDSDDYLTSNAVEKIYNNWKNDKGWCGISFLRGYDEKLHIGNEFPEKYFEDTFINVRCNKCIKGDKAEVWVTKLLKNTPFLEIENEKFFSENYVWIRMSKEYSMLFVNEIIYITEYLEEGLTKSGRRLIINSPIGAMYNAKEVITNEAKFNVQLKHNILYLCYSFFAKQRVMHTIIKSPKPLQSFLVAPFALVVYAVWKYKYDSK